ncbi:Nup93/Nic96-domain-containing protein [Spinellus fusiger]|nr:Nup93/Nic96-domain-containing protein [Spinellus fusiger]
MFANNNDNGFSRLYEASKRLANPSPGNHLPLLQRPLEQLIEEIKAWDKDTPIDEELIEKGRAFLAKHGIDTPENSMVPDIFQGAFVKEPHLTISSTNIKKHVQETVDTTICDILEASKKDITIKTNKMREKAIEEARKRHEKSLQQIKEKETLLKPTVKGNEEQDILQQQQYKAAIKKRVLDYGQTVAGLNEQRLTRKEVAIASLFLATAKQENKENASINAWNLVSWLTGEEDASEQLKLEAAFLKGRKDQQSQDAIEMRQNFIKVLTKWHEYQLVRCMDLILLEKARTIKVGGNPEFSHRLKTCVKLTFMTNNVWNDTRWEISNDLPKWVYTYLLIRTGHFSHALAYMIEQEKICPEDELFVNCFKEYMESPHHLLSKESHKALTFEYQRLKYNGESVDPYKLLMYKLIGRCELYEKSVADAINTTEDYLWLQLSLVREGHLQDDYGHERYTLADLQALILSLGPKMFEKEKDPWGYFNVLVSTMQFEQAVHYLHQQESTRIDAVHFGICFAYYGLLRIPEGVSSTGEDLLVEEANKVPRLRFEQLIYHYVCLYVDQHSHYALHYLYLLGIYSVRNGYESDALVKLARKHVCELVFSTKLFKGFLGETSMREGRKPGVIDHHMTLLEIHSEDELIKEIILPVARWCSEAGLYEEAVEIQEMALDYNGAVNSLLHQLANAFMRPLQHPPKQQPLDKQRINKLIDFTSALITSYKRNVYVKDILAQPKVWDVHTLIDLLHFREVYEQGQYEKALQHMYQTGFVPLHKTDNQLKKTLCALKQKDRVLVQCLPRALDMVTDTLKALRLPSAISDPENSTVGKEIYARNEEYAQCIFEFVGQAMGIIPEELMSDMSVFTVDAHQNDM